MLLAAALAGAAGCKTADNPSAGGPEPAGAEPRLVRQPRPPIHDLPVPVNFVLDQKRSGNLDAPGVRLVDHLYKGRDDKIAVRLFYVTEMPLHQWRLVTAMFSQGRVVLNFEKKTERCHVEVFDGSWWHPTYIQARIFTVGPGTVSLESQGVRTPRQ
jgi:hypothetical protein